MSRQGDNEVSRINLKVNGELHDLDADDEDLLLYVLRYGLELNGPKFGCGLAQCGACTVLVDGHVTRSCQTVVTDVIDADIITLEGLGTLEEPGPIQQAFIDEQAAQCGYCINGMIMTAQALLQRIPDPTDEQIRSALNANLCRCGTHTRIVRAIKRAAGKEVTA